MPKRLPAHIVETLRDYREFDRPKFDSLLLGLVNSGWSFSQIGKPFGITRSAVNQWHKRAVKAGLAPAVIQPLDHPPLTLKGSVRRVRPDIPKDERESLREIAELAGKNTRWSEPTSAERQASVEFEKLIKFHVLHRKVPVATFAKRSGVTSHAIRQRLAKDSGRIVS